MKLKKNLVFTTLTMAALTACAWAQTEISANASPGNAIAVSAPAPASAPITAADIQELKSRHRRNCNDRFRRCRRNRKAKSWLSKKFNPPILLRYRLR